MVGHPHSSCLKWRFEEWSSSSQLTSWGNLEDENQELTMTELKQSENDDGIIKPAQKCICGLLLHWRKKKKTTILVKSLFILVSVTSGQM